MKKLQGLKYMCQYKIYFFADGRPSVIYCSSPKCTVTFHQQGSLWLWFYGRDENSVYLICNSIKLYVVFILAISQCDLGRDDANNALLFYL